MALLVPSATPEHPRVVVRGFLADALAGYRGDGSHYPSSPSWAFPSGVAVGDCDCRAARVDGQVPQQSTGVIRRPNRPMTSPATSGDSISSAMAAATPGGGCSGMAGG